MQIWLKRAYEPPGPQDGTRVLVDRLWPRGVSKEEAQIDLWLKQIAPSDSLRKWFNHDPNKWESFKERYYQELKADKPEQVRDLADIAGQGRVTLVFGAKDERLNNAAALKEYLEKNPKNPEKRGVRK
ncbi:MAG: DUF488 domain-containing protein [Desulfobacteraceae bacterium]